MSVKAMEMTTTGLRALTKSEIDRRIELVVTHVALLDGEGAEDAAHDLRPRWISTAELVRRMQPFLCRN